MGIRLRASGFGQVAEIDTFRANRKTGFFAKSDAEKDRTWDRARVVCLFARGFQQLLSSSQRRLL